MSVLRTAVFVLVLGVVSSPAFAQATAYGYAFGGPGAAISGNGGIATLQLGGGVEGRFPTGVAVSADVAYLTPAEAWSYGIGLFSPNVSYYARQQKHLAPFVTGGYSLAFRDGVAHGWNIGGGFEYSRRPGIALRVEVRNHIYDWGEAMHFVSLRIGASFPSR